LDFILDRFLAVLENGKVDNEDTHLSGKRCSISTRFFCPSGKQGRDRYSNEQARLASDSRRFSQMKYPWAWLRGGNRVIGDIPLLGEADLVE
jgi:hypothetical protein